MTFQNTYNDAHVQFGISEVYIHPSFDFNLLKKLQQRAEITLEGTDPIVSKYMSYDMIVFFQKGISNQNFIYRFLKFLNDNPTKERDFKEAHTLLNEEELFDAIKLKNFTLITHRNLLDE